ncbi:hypothetical protein VP1G_10941 [Cytospora mali]|uniref:HNH nuclease domain-containing protein n=1 Tax=Cytospora mali TaxID=578113 RepID=A0A194V116_CYTMA|nr:hypothetical protein VP1G_10941 [Valsa mali var. pyri (nom. inval.)]
MRSFRDDVWRLCCVITREGNLGGKPSPGIDATHIVPQSQWHTFPMSDDQDTADPNSIDKLNCAWMGTWSSITNGIMLENTLQKCFNARIIAFHPGTHIIRAFIDLGLITKFHGKRATLPSDIPKKVLQHHWDMCCLEYTPSMVVPTSVLTDVPELPREGGLLEDISDDEGYGHSRGRSREKKRCIATEENGGHGMKRQRLESLDRTSTGS